MSDHNAHAETEKPSVLSNVLAIIGLIILVVIIIWGLVHLAELSSGWFSSLFEKSAPTLKIDAPSDGISGAPVSISWDYSTTATGTYAFIYQCQPDVQFAIINSSNNTAAGIPCGNAASVTPVSGAIEMLPILTSTSSASVPFSIIFTPATGTAVQGSATIMIHPGSAETGTQATQTTTQTGTTGSQTSTTPAKTTTTAPATTAAPRSYAPADLSVRIVAESVDQYGNGIVTFNIQNVGGTTSGSYYFSAQMPTQRPLPYTSTLQAPLKPSSYIVDTLRFSQAVSGTFSVSVGARDGNQTNNYASVFVTAPTIYNGSNPYNVQYQSQPYTY
jgi:hypothetical protein